MRQGRFIPAYAGNAGPAGPAGPGSPVHPRIRGERCGYWAMADIVDGSSPHTRGTPFHRLYRFPTMRFIPAYAGNAPAWSRPLTGFPVHPRIRGERIDISNAPRIVTGSSPHTRGTPQGRAEGAHRCRFIPAYAGNALHTSRRPSGWPVHPRIRGERAPSLKASLTPVGSSPHTRGTRPPPSGGLTCPRFIPAYAGNAGSSA